MNRMEQLIGFVEVEHRNNPDKLHIADWALTEIERLTAALTAAEADARRYRRLRKCMDDALDDLDAIDAAQKEKP